MVPGEELHEVSLSISMITSLMGLLQVARVIPSAVVVQRHRPQWGLLEVKSSAFAKHLLVCWW